jgi:hypothetical protein
MTRVNPQSWLRWSRIVSDRFSMHVTIIPRRLDESQM